MLACHTKSHKQHLNNNFEKGPPKVKTNLNPKNPLKVKKICQAILQDRRLTLVVRSEIHPWNLRQPADQKHIRRTTNTSNLRVWDTSPEQTLRFDSCGPFLHALAALVPGQELVLAHATGNLSLGSYSAQWKREARLERSFLPLVPSSHTSQIPGVTRDCRLVCPNGKGIIYTILNIYSATPAVWRETLKTRTYRCGEVSYDLPIPIAPPESRGHAIYKLPALTLPHPTRPSLACPS